MTANAPLLETGSGTVGQTLELEIIENLPINGRDYTILARLSTGVVPPQPGARAPLMFSANGVRPAQNNYMLDGIDNNTSNVDFLSGVAYIVKPPVDAVDEIKILTSSFSAEYGRAGGAVLNTTLKSGSNQFRGSVWEFARDDASNATDFFANRANLKKGEYSLEPVRHDRRRPDRQTGKTFFFADYEGSLIKQARTWVTTVPTAAQRASGFTDFSDLIAAAERQRRHRHPRPHLPARHGLRSGDDAAARRRPGRSGHGYDGDARRLRARLVRRQPHPGRPAQRGRAAADEALSGAERRRPEQQLRGQPQQHRRHPLVRRPRRPQLQQATIASSPATASRTTTSCGRRRSTATPTAAGSTRATRRCASTASRRATRTCSRRR